MYLTGFCGCDFRLLGVIPGRTLPDSLNQSPRVSLPGLEGRTHIESSAMYSFSQDLVVSSCNMRTLCSDKQIIDLMLMHLLVK